MKNGKIMAIAAALMMMAACTIVVGTSDDSDALSAGSMNIYIYDGEGWCDYLSVEGYNALEALMSIDGIDVDADDEYIIELTNLYGTYDDINLYYGELNSINEIEADEYNVWNIFIYQSGWVVAPTTLGFIQPFSDAACASANVVLYYGTQASNVPTDVVNHVSSPASLIIPSGSNYKFTFELKIQSGAGTPTIANNTSVTYIENGIESTKTLTASDLYTGITVVGYGSNAYAALKNAIGTANVVGSENPGAYYGWITTIFSLGTVSGLNYTYWATYFSDNSYTSFGLGAYSTLENVPTGPILGGTDEYDMVQSAFKLTYELYIFN